MSPNDAIVQGGLPPGGTARALVAPGEAVAIYLRKQSVPSDNSGALTSLQIDLAPGVWQAEWVDTKLGDVVGMTRVDGGGIRTVDAPPYDTDIALRLRRRN
jgi:hypothetical protein